MKSLFLKPLSLVYGLILFMRHWLYDRGFFLSKSYDIPIIKIGNLSLGGTGKSPFTIYIANQLSADFNEMIISRGYGRKTKGFRYVRSHDIATRVGDEPLMMRRSLLSGIVTVSESRTEAIEYLIKKEKAEKPVFILDDSLQHRAVGSGFQILLTKADNLFTEDELLPLGRLRDLKSRAQFADIIVVTNSNSDTDKKQVLEKLNKYSKNPVIFSKIEYLPFRNFFTEIDSNIDSQIILVSALASNKSFKNEVLKNSKILKEFDYRDHYFFKSSDVSKWISSVKEHSVRQIITTEKDAVKLIEFRQYFEENKVELIVLPIRIELDEESNTILTDCLNKYLNQFYTKS